MGLNQPLSALPSPRMSPIDVGRLIALVMMPERSHGYPDPSRIITPSSVPSAPPGTQGAISHRSQYVKLTTTLELREAHDCMRGRSNGFAALTSLEQAVVHSIPRTVNGVR
jgi:hypothetical protein